MNFSAGKCTMNFWSLNSSFICSTVWNASWRVNCCENVCKTWNYLCNRLNSLKIWLRSFTSVDSPSIFSTHDKSLSTMLNYVRQFFKIRVVFHTFYFWHEVGDPQFCCISDTSSSLSDCIKKFKKSIDYKIFARTSSKGRNEEET